MCDFSSFIEEINKYSKGVHMLYPAAPYSCIKEAERELCVTFPQVYIDFLLVYNGGELFVPGTELHPVKVPALLDSPGLTFLNDIQNNSLPDMPETLFIFADTNYGDPICFNFDKQDCQECEVVQWSHEDGEISRRWNGFREWLMDALDEGSMITDYDGSDKDLI